MAEEDLANESNNNHMSSPNKSNSEFNQAVIRTYLQSLRLKIIAKTRVVVIAMQKIK